mgnify:CR=1 FL=1
MSSPFQQSFMGKNPFKTAKKMTDAVKAADTEFYKDIDPYEAEGNRLLMIKQVTTMTMIKIRKQLRKKKVR